MCAFFLSKQKIPASKSIFCNVRLNTDPSQVAQVILIHGGLEMICDEVKLTEASFC